MTTVEALACGVPVVAVDRGGLGEVAAGHALMIDTPSVEQLSRALLRVLNEQPLRAELKRLARARGAALRWDVIARQTLDIIRAVADERKER